ncbi:AraC family transcriptional regulator [Chitinophaga qingshengii]|uniref:Helix-turn-helix transcriptional regulator n=1 Tax=Chitinophaga qingshengii TaxID=1569794 RepID=A0ABR7TZD3_9BACT|nr:AraC family transcriptional regulator [Chitinophaga qingshengii]MBC9934704.1 helix-turn-helix transcriptional regulator [Chitinophaga qingshengii]
MADHKINPSGITYSCYYKNSRDGEQFVPEHVLSYQLAGRLTIDNADKTFVFNEGDLRLIRRNQLIKFLKEPPENGPFQTLSIYLDQDVLKNFSLEYGYKAETSGVPDGNNVIKLKDHPLSKSFMMSLLPYVEEGQVIHQELQRLKQREAIMILLQSQPELKEILFDFREPGKIDLEEFMNRNFHFNVQLKRFAYLTGRSLATFKRDFEHIFHTSPSRWLLQRRLQEAHYLIREKGRMPSDVYLETGFEDLSHFSFAFKKMYGVAPSKLAG